MRQSHTVTLTKAGKKFWGTKKNSLRFVVTDQPVTLSGGYWDGGSRDEYHGMTKTGTVALAYPTDPPQFGGGQPTSFLPSDNLAIVHGGVFCGNTRALTVYVAKLEDWFLPGHGTIKA